jgi:DNA polymerase-3 subunit beta
MKIVIAKKTLAAALAVVAPLAGKAKALPILNDVLFFTKGDRIRLQTSDQQSMMRRYCTATEISEDGQFCVDCAMLLKIINSLPEQPIELVADSGLLTIRHSKGEASIPLDEDGEFPEMPDSGDEATELHIPAAQFRSAVSLARPFIGSDDLRPIMSNIYMELSQDKFTFCATDSHRLIMGELPREEKTSGEGTFLLDATSATLLSKIEPDVEEVIIRAGEKNVSYKIGATLLIARLTEGNYPRFRSVIPQNQIKCTVDRKALLESVSRVGLLSPTASGLIKMEFSMMDVRLTADDLDYSRKSTETVPLTAGADVKIGVKGEFLAQALRSFDEQEVNLLLRNESTPILIQGVENNIITTLVMPMMLNA